MRSNMSTYTQRSQRGAALITVLMILIMITVIGVIAMRQGLTSLGVATNAQVQTLLVQSADAPINQIVQASLGGMDNITLATKATGMALTLSGADKNNELVFCYRPTVSDPFGLFINANIIKGNTDGSVTTVDNGGNGFCDLTTATDFGSARNTVVTQVAITSPLNTSNSPLAYLQQGNNFESNAVVPHNAAALARFRVTSTSMLPAFSASPLAAVQSDCLQGRVSDNTDAPLVGVENITDCLARKGVPANTQVQEFVVYAKYSPS